MAFHGVVGFRAKRKKKGIAKGKSFCDRRLTSAKGPKRVGIGGWAKGLGLSVREGSLKSSKIGVAQVLLEEEKGCALNSI